MADEVEDDLILTPPEGMDDQDEAENGNPDEGEDEFSIEFEGEVAEDETPLVKKLREELRDRERQLATIRKSEAPKIEVGPKPDLDDFWHEGDPAAAFEKALVEWHDRKLKVETAEADASRAQQAREAEEQQRVINYRAKAAALPVKDFDVAEAAVVGALPQMHQSALLAYVDEPARLVYALYKHPQMLDKLAGEPDVIKALKMAWNMERNLKVTTRKKPPTPEAETIQRGSVAMTQTTDREEERLRAQAEKSGDYSALTRYKTSKKKAA